MREQVVDVFRSFCYILWQGKLVIEVKERKISLINFLFLKSRLLPIAEESGQNTKLGISQSIIFTIYNL